MAFSYSLNDMHIDRSKSGILIKISLNKDKNNNLSFEKVRLHLHIESYEKHW